MPYPCTILANPNGPNFKSVEEAVRTINGLQTYFRCKLVPDTAVLGKKDKKVKGKKVAKAIHKQYPGSDVIAITESYYSPDLVFDEHLPGRILISCSDWDDRPPLSLFLIYSIASALITLRAQLTTNMNEAMSHEPPIGCIFDWWGESSTLNLDFVCARLCGKCKDELRKLIRDESVEAFESLQRLLDFVRRTTMGAVGAIPSKVWIVHGRGTDWKILKAILHELGVTAVDEFNEKAVVGMPIVDRWKEMLNAARFAFALITEDDELNDKKHSKQPRLNVAHEIGLCHARLGLEGTAILREGKATVPTNLSGINYLAYKKGKLRDKKPEIELLLKEVGVIA